MLTDVRTWKDEQADAAKVEAKRKAQRAASMRWARHNSERVNAAARARYAANPGPALARVAQWKRDNAGRWATYLAAWRERNAWRLGGYRLRRSSKEPERLLSGSYGFCQLHDNIHGTDTLDPSELMMLKEELGIS